MGRRDKLDVVDVAEQRSVQARRGAGGHGSLRWDIGREDVPAVGESGGWLHSQRDGSGERRAGLRPGWLGALRTGSGNSFQPVAGYAEVQLVGDPEGRRNILVQHGRERATRRPAHQLAK